MRSHSLADEFRKLAATLRESGAAHEAEIWDIAASRAETHEIQHGLEALSLTAAAAESGYSTSQLGRLVKNGTIENQGTPGRPLIARKDLPRKLPTTKKSSGVRSIADDVLAAQGTGSPTK